MSSAPGRFMSQVAAAASGTAPVAVSDSKLSNFTSNKSNWVIIFAVVVLGVALIYLISKCRKIDSKVKQLETQQRSAMDNSDVENIVGHVLAQTENQRQIQTAKIAQGVTDQSIGQLLGYLQERGVISAPKKEPAATATATVVEEMKKEEEKIVVVEDKKEEEVMYDSDSEGDAATRVRLPPQEDPSSVEFKSLLKTEK